MKKILVFVFAFYIYAPLVKAQTNNITTTDKFGSQIFLSDVYGRAFVNMYADATGTPYFLPDYKYATITLTDGRKYINVKSKINLVKSLPIGCYKCLHICLKYNLGNLVEIGKLIYQLFHILKLN